MTCAGVLLTGGGSRRLGRDKAMVRVGGETLAARSARVLAAVCDPVVEAGPGVSGLRAVREDPPFGGPVAGVLAAVDALAADAVAVHAPAFDRPVLVLACDLPRVDVALLRVIADWPGERSVVPVVGGRGQYACARYSTAAIARARASGVTSLRELADRGVVFLDEGVWGKVATPEMFRDVDTPGDLDSLGL